MDWLKIAEWASYLLWAAIAAFYMAAAVKKIDEWEEKRKAKP